MELTSFTDYSLRLLIYLARMDSERTSIDEMSEFYGISRHHVAKIVKRLSDLGYISTVRGKNGGVALAKDPTEINIGLVIRQAEPHFNLVECIGTGSKSACVIHGSCKLKGALLTARGHFFEHLNQFTLSDVASEDSVADAI